MILLYIPAGSSGNSSASNNKATNTVKGRNNQHSLKYALILSILAHILMFYFFLNSPIVKTKQEVSPIKINFIESRIAPPSQSPKQSPILTKRILLSDKDTAAKIESIKRGEISKKQIAKKTPTKKVQSKKLALKKEQTIKKLVVNKNSIPKLKLGTFDIENIAPSSDFLKKTEPAPKQELQAYEPFVQNYRQGLPDVLKNIKDGEVTLLNAKASKFAVFVRRVAIKVFSELKHSSWSSLSYASARKLRKFSTVEVKMNKKGQLISARIIDTSGVANFDSLLLNSSEVGAWDNNPPSGAVAADGFIYFIFKAKTWAVRQGDSRRERRWILLSTGLK